MSARDNGDDSAPFDLQTAPSASAGVPREDRDRTPHSDAPRSLQGAGVALLREHLARAVPQMDGDAAARRTVRGIVRQLGERLGFRLQQDAGEDVDVWASPAGASLVVRAVAAADVPDQLRALARARDHLLLARGVPARRMSTLLVVCGSLVNWRQVEDAAVVRRVADHARLIALDALVSLVELRADQALAHTDAVTLLRPQGVRADALVEIVTRGVRRGQTGVKPGSDRGQIGARPQAGTNPGPEGRPGWTGRRAAAVPVVPRSQNER